MTAEQREARRASSRRHYEKHKDRLKIERADRKAQRAEYAKKYRMMNKERLREQKKAQVAMTKEARAAYQFKYREANKGRLREKQKARPVNKEARAEYQRAYREANKDRLREQKKAWIVANKDRRRENDRRRRLGISPQQFNDAVAAQSGKCGICGECLMERPPRTVHADHDHATGAFRGVLCADCNLGLGRFKDNTDRLQRAIDYLKQSPTSREDHTNVT